MYSLDVKRMHERKQREQAWKQRVEESPNTKAARVQRIYGKSPDDMYREYNQRVEQWLATTAETSPEWKDTYGHLTNAVENPMIWPRDSSKEIGPQFIDAGKYVPRGKYRGGGDCLQSPPPPEPRKPFTHGNYEDPIDSPFRQRAKGKEIQGPLRYNTVVREYPDKQRDYDSTWTEPKPLPQWRFPDPALWTDGEFGLTFNSRDTKASLFEGIARRKHVPSIAATDPGVPRPIVQPQSRPKVQRRIQSAPHAKLYMNSLLSVNTETSHKVLSELAAHKSKQHDK
ncbi:hypothetical protein Ae201684P_021024 [Aphanomyces euteiches]|nr:hypothetical protein Ae201684P_021024 [Aphanomyces euteiches]